MTLYAYVKKYRESNWGRVLSISDGPAPGAGPGPVGASLENFIVVITSGSPEEDWYYDFDTNTFTDVSPGLEAPRRKVAAKDFWFAHFTALERAKVWALCDGRTDVPKHDNSGPVPDPGITNHYRLVSFRDLTINGSFYLDEPELCTVVDALETIGLLAPGRANAILERP